MKELLLAVISSYVNGTINIEKFQDWYVPKLEELVDNLDTINIISQVELGLAEIDDDLITEDYFKNYLKRYVLSKKEKENERSKNKDSGS